MLRLKIRGDMLNAALAKEGSKRGVGCGRVGDDARLLRTANWLMTRIMAADDGEVTE